MQYGPQSSDAESIVLSQVVRGRPTGLLQSVGGLSGDDTVVVSHSPSGAERATCPKNLRRKNVDTKIRKVGAILDFWGVIVPSVPAADPGFAKGGAMASALSASLNGGLEWSPQRGPEPLVGAQGTKPPKLKASGPFSCKKWPKVKDLHVNENLPPCLRQTDSRSKEWPTTSL